MKSRPNRFGFTLLELLLAMALSAVLLASISSSIWHHYKARGSAQRTIDDSRTLLAMSRDIRQDLSLFTASLSKAIPVSSLQNVTISERVLNFNYVFQHDTVALYGNRDFIALGRTIPVTNQMRSAKVSPQLANQCVIWSSLPSEQLQVPFLKMSRQIGFLSMPQSLDHWQAQIPSRYSLLLGNPCQLSESKTYPSTNTLMRFRFFDQGQWFESWDSVSSGHLPQAIEVEFPHPKHAQTYRMLCNLDLENIR